MLTDHELAALRRAAALARLVSHVELDVVHGATTTVRVEAHPCRHGEERGRLRRIHPCGFHEAVARAWDDHGHGRMVTLIGGRGPLELVWRVPAPGADLGFGTLRTTCAGRFVWAFAALLPVDDLVDVLADVGPPSLGRAARGDDSLSARLAPDERLGATVVHVDADVHVACLGRPVHTVALVHAIDDVMVTLLATVTAAELLAGLAAPRT